MSENYAANPSAMTAHAHRLSSYQGDLELASDALRQASANKGAFGGMVGPFIAPLFQLVEAGDKLSQSLIASARDFEAHEAASAASLTEVGPGGRGGLGVR